MGSLNQKLEGFGKRLAESRRSKDFTQGELANRLGVTPQALSKWENGTSSPDLSMLSSICEILNVSADYLLGVHHSIITEDGNEDIKNRIWNNLQMGCLEALELVFDPTIIPTFVEGDYMGKIFALRLKLSEEGILMPVIRLRDRERLRPNEFMVLAYQNVLYDEELSEINENTLDYIIEKLGQTIRSSYAEIINVDILKSFVDNYKMKYPVLIEGVVPNKIPYALLLEVSKAFISRGNNLSYLPKMIEIMERELRANPSLTAAELTERVISNIERADNADIMLAARK